MQSHPVLKAVFYSTLLDNRDAGYKIIGSVCFPVQR